MKQKLNSYPEICNDRESNMFASNFLTFEPQKSKFNQLTDAHDIKINSQFVIHLRGGGCGQAKPSQQIEEKVIIGGVPNDFLINLEKYVNIIKTNATLIADTSKRNEVIISLQWFMNNREHLNTCCANKKLTSSIYTKILNFFGDWLKILPVYLRASWFLCYQVLQICSEFLRIIYSFQIQNEERQIELTMQQEFLQDLEEFKAQLEIEQANVWNTGIEYEITLIKIMLMNCQTNSKEGQNLLINVVKNIAQSALQMSPTEDLIPSLIEGAKFLFLQYKDKVLYPEEVYATYYLFQTLKWSIVRQLKSKYSVYNQIKQLKDAFQQYILNSDNWIIHYSWISMIIDILAYRPIIDKFEIVKGTLIEQQSMWNTLIENNLILTQTYNRNQATIILFQNQVKYITKEINNLLESQGIKKFKLLSESLLKGQFTQQINLWNFYKDFSFKKKQETIIKDYEIVLENNDLLFIEKQIQRFNSQLDELALLDQQIKESFTHYFSQSNNTQFEIKLLQDDYSVFAKQFLDAYKLALYHLNFIIERSTIEFVKLQLLTPYLDNIKSEVKQNLSNIFKNIEELIKVKFQDFQEDFLKNFVKAIEYLSYLSEISLNLKYKKQTDLENVNSKFQIQYYLSTNQDSEQQSIFQQFILVIKEFQQKFSFSMSSIKTNNYHIKITPDQIQAMSIAACSGKWIKIIKQYIFSCFLDRFNLLQNEVKIKDDLEQTLINCTFSLKILQFMKQFYQIHIQKVKIFDQNIDEEKLQTIQEQEKFIQQFQLLIIKLLTQQQESLASILKQKDIDKGSNLCKEKKKQLLQQLKSDCLILQNEYENVTNQEMKVIKSQVLIFTQEAIFIVLQNQNELYDIDALESQMQKYHEIISQIKDSYTNYNNSLSQAKKRTFQDWIRKNKHSDLCYFCVDQHLQQIKNTIKLLKLFEQLLVLIINQFQQTDDCEITKQIDNFNRKRQQLDSKFNIKTQITKLIEILKASNQHERCKCINQIEQENDQQNEQIESTLQEILDFFLLKQKTQQQISQKLDPLYLNVINNLCEQVIIKKSIFDVFDFNNDYKIRECLVYNLIKLEQGIKEEQIVEFSSKLIQYLWVFEKDQRVRNLLKNKELIEMQKLFFSKDIKTMSEQIKQEMKFRINNIESISQELKLEGNSQIKDKLKQQLILAYEELEQYNDNITEMSEKMDISLIFLKDISKDVKQIKNQIDNLQESLNQVGDDIRKLRGKRYDELLEIRKQKILLQSKLAEVDSVYVQLKTIEFDPVTGQSIKSNDGITITKLMSEQWDDFKGEVNEFIWDESKSKDVMLLSGNAGSGKSKAARKIEEFLWKQIGIHSKWIPIYVSLPTLKNPKYNLFEQALESENYQFDKYQLREFKEAIQNKKESIILILDSYDEMKQDCIQQNLIITNKLINDLNIDQNEKQVKIIITTRREILNTLGYQTWFYGDSISSLKEVQIQDFDKDQKSDYLIQYAELSVKRKIRAVYDFLKQISQQNFNLDEFLAIWHEVGVEVQQSIKNSHKAQSESIFENSQREDLIKKILDNSTFKYLKEEQITGLRKDLSSLWSVFNFEKAIENVGISDLLSTPFMLEIIVQILPNMTKQQQGSVDLKNRFVQSYLSITNKSNLSKKLQETYKNNLQQKANNLGMIQKIFEQYNKSEYPTKINQILDQLESLKFFQSYSITSILKIDGDNLLVDNKSSYKLYNQDIECVVQALKMKKYTIFEFYDSFIHFYHDQQIQKLRETGKISNWESFKVDILQFSSNLAMDMTINQLSQITYQQKGKLKQKNNYNKYQDEMDWLDEYFNDSQQELDYNKLIRSCILLNAKGSSYSFTHKSIQEFFVAKFILDFLLQSSTQFLNDSNLDQKYKDRLMQSLYNQSKLNISKDHYKGVLTFIKDILNSLENIKGILINIVRLSRDDKFQYAASNSIYLLSQLDAYLGYEDFQRIHLVDTNISGLSFCYSDFSKSKFKNVNINSCNFNYATLTDVEWNEVICKEKPFLKLDEEIKVVEFSPNGKLIASNGKGNFVILWDVETYKIILELDGHEGEILSVAFSLDCKTLASSSKDKTIKLWDIQNLLHKQLIITITYHNHPVTGVKFTSDGKKIVSADNSGMLKACNLEVISEKPDDIIFEYEQDLLVCTLTQDDKLIALGLDDSSIKLIELETKKERVLIGHTGQITALAFSKNGNKLVSACTNLLLSWDLRDDCRCQVLSFQEYRIQYLTIPNERQLVIGAENLLAYGEFQYDNTAYFTHIQQSSGVQLFPNSNFAVVVQDQIIYILDLTTQAIINSICFKNDISYVKHDSDEKILTIKTGQLTIFLDTNTFQEVLMPDSNNNVFIYQNLIFQQCENEIIIHDDKNKNFDKSDNSQNFLIENIGEIEQFSFKANQQLFAFNCVDKGIFLYDYKEKRLIDNQFQNKRAKSIAFSPCKPILSIIYDDESLYFWNISKAPFECQKFNEDILIESINYSPDGSLLIIKERYNKIRILDEINEQEIKIQEFEFTIYGDIQVSFDNKTLAIFKSYGKYKIILWDLNSNKEKILQDEDEYHYSPIIQFSLDGITLACLADTKLRFINIITGQNIINYQLPQDSSYSSISFSKDGKFFVTAGKYIRVWKYLENDIEMISAYRPDALTTKLLLIDDDQNLVYLLNKCLTITPLSKCNLKGIIQTSQRIASFLTNGYLVTGHNDKVEIFDWKQQQSIFKIPASVSDVKFFSDNLHCITTNYRTITKMNIYSKEQIFNLLTSDYIQKAKLIKNDQILILECNNTIKLLNLEDSSNVYEFGSYTNYDLQQFSWTSNNDYICYRPNSDFVIRDIKSQQKNTFIFLQDKVLQVNSFDSENKIFILLFRRDQNCSGIFNLIQQKFEISVQYWHNTNSAISFNGQLIAYNDDNKNTNLKFYDFPNDQWQNTVVDDDRIIPIQLSKNGDFLYGCDGYKQDKQVKILSINEQKQLKMVCSLDFESEVKKVSVTPSFGYITVMYSKILKLVNLNWIYQAQMVSINEVKQNAEIRIPFVISQDNTKIITGQSRYFRIYQLDSKIWQVFYNESHNESHGIINCLVEIDKNTICVGSNTKIQLINLDKQESIILGKHENYVTSLSYFKKQSLLASSGEDQKIFLWNVNAKKKIAMFEGHAGIVNQLSFSPDGKCMASASDDKQIKLWNIELSEQSKISKGHSKCVNQVAFSKDGLILASCSEDHSIILWDLIEKNFIIMLEEHTQNVVCLQFSFCSKWLASGSYDQSICFWDVKFPYETTLIYKIKEMYLYPDQLWFSPSGEFATISDDDGQQNREKPREEKQKVTKMQVWSLNQIGKQDQKFQICRDQINPICISDNSIVFYGYDKLVKVHEILANTCQNLEGHQHEVVMIKSWGQKVLSVDKENIMIIWQKTNNSWKKQSQNLLESSIIQIDTINYDSEDCIISMNSDSIIVSNLYQMQKQKPFIDLIFDHEGSACYTSDSQNLFLFLNYSRNEIIILDSFSGEIKNTISNLQNSQHVLVSKDDRLLAISDDLCSQIKIFEIYEKNEEVILDLESMVKIFEFSWDDSNILYSAEKNNKIRKWNIKNKSNEFILELESSYDSRVLQFSRRCNCIVYSTNYNQLSLIHLINKQKYQIHKEDYISQANFSDNEILIAIFTQDNKIYLWNYEKYIITETNLFKKLEPLNLTFTNNDTELVCCQNTLICVFYIQENLQLKLKYKWQIESCGFYAYCPKHQSVLIYKQYEKKQIIFMNPGQTQILIDEKHNPLNFHSTYKGNFIASISQKGFIIWDLKNKKQILNTDQWKGNTVMLIELENMIIGSEKEIKILDITNIDNIKEIKNILFDQTITSLQFSSKLQHFVCEFDTKIKVWRLLNDGLCQQVAIYDTIYKEQKNPVISANGDFIVYKQEEFLELIMIKQLYTKNLQHNTVYGLQYSSDYSHLITLIDGFPQLFTSTLEQIENELESSIKEQKGLAIKSASIDSIFAILCYGCILIVKIIDKNKLTLIRKIDQEKMISLSINPLGTLLIAGNDVGSIHLWDLITSNNMDNSQPNLIIENQNNYIVDFTFSPNGNELSTAVFDGSINLYSVDKINKTQNIKKNDKNQEQSQIQVIENMNKEFRLICYKSFSRQSLLLANQCIMKNSQIKQNQQSILQLFKQKGAIE